MSALHPRHAHSVLVSSLVALIFGGCLASGVLAGEESARPADPKAQAAELIAAMRSKDPDVRVEAVERAAANQHDSLTSPLVRLLADDELGVRYAAMKALGAREGKGARRKAASALTPRLRRLRKHPADREELLRVIDALRLLQQPSSIKPLLDDIDLHMEFDEVEARMYAVANVPHADAIERLIQFLAKGRRGGSDLKKQREAAQNGLRYATGQRFGTDPDKWRAWWRENRKDFSFEAMADMREQEAREQREKAERRKKRKARDPKKGKRKKRSDGEEGKPKKGDDA